MCYGFTWASKIGVCVVPGVLVILEHIQASGLRKYNLCKFKNDNTNPMFQADLGWNKTTKDWESCGMLQYLMFGTFQR